MTPEHQQELNRLIGGRASGLMQHAQAFVDFWKQLDPQDQELALSEMLQKFKLPEFRTDHVIETETIPDTELPELTNRLGVLIDATISVVLTNRQSLEEAVREVQHLLEGRSKDEEKVFCAAGILASNLVPYAAIPEAKLKLTNEQYQGLLKELSSGVAKMRIASGVSQNAAEMADLVLSILEEEIDWDKRVALLSYFIVLRERTVAMGQMNRDAQQRAQDGQGVVAKGN